MLSALSGVFMLNLKGEILISRVYRDDITKAASDVFRLQVIAAKDVRSPIKSIYNTHFFHIRVENVYLMTASKANVNVSTVFEILYKIVGLLRNACGGMFNEEAVLEHYILIYEMLDEMFDNGYPQSTGDELFKLYMTQKGKFKSKTAEAVSMKTNQVTGAIPWRPPDLRYKKNEMFIDIIEHVNVLWSNKGTVLHADVSGEVKLKAFLSGMPECRFGLNDKLLMDREARAGGPPPALAGAGVPAGVHATASRAGGGIELDDCTFHQCVRLGKFDADRSITFIPPDGEFVLMKYRTTEAISTPFRIIPIVTETATRVEIKLTVKADFHSKMFGTEVQVVVPTPKNTAVCKVQSVHGRARYEPGQNAIVWRFKKFPGEQECHLTADIDLLSQSNKLEKKAWQRTPIAMQFSVPMFTASGLHVRFLKVVEPKMHYQTIKWVRYITQAGSYQHRM